MLKNACDTHTHTLFSKHAYSTVEEDVRAASEVGLELLGIADHFAAMIALGSNITEYQHFINMSCWPREWYGVKLLRAAEVDILSKEGNLFGEDIMIDLDIVGEAFQPRTLFELCAGNTDYLIGSVHGRSLRSLSQAEGTAMYCKVLEHPKVLMLGHIGRAGVPFELDTVLTAARDLGKLIEINEHSLDFAGKTTDTCQKIAERCAELGTQIVVNTDAHISFDIGKPTRALAMLEAIDFPQELIATRSAASFKAALEGALGPMRLEMQGF